jgi:hypothetical protein
MTPEVKAAIAEIEKQYEGHAILVGPDKDGGACVIVEGIPLGESYDQLETWVGFHITVGCPYADTYPHFVRGDLTRKDKAGHNEAFQPNHSFPLTGVVVGNTITARNALQISRRSNHRDPSGIETPLLKMMKVVAWFNSL